ncbi:hypothetical protein [Kitasatospora sp. NPDC059088]
MSINDPSPDSTCVFSEVEDVNHPTGVPRFDARSRPVTFPAGTR